MNYRKYNITEHGPLTAAEFEKIVQLDGYNVSGHRSGGRVLGCAILAALVTLVVAIALATGAPLNPRADVNGDGCVNAADLLEVRRPGNWGECSEPAPTPTPSPPPVPMRQLIEWTDGGESTPFDIRTSGRLLRDLEIVSNARGVVAVRYWGTAGLTIEGCLLRTHSYGIYSEIDRLVVRDTEITATHRDPIRIAGGRDGLIDRVRIGPTVEDVAFRIHGDAENWTIRNCRIEATNPWAIAIGPQFPGAKLADGKTLERPRRITIEDVEIVACPQTVLGIRVQAEEVTIRNVRGIGFDQTMPGAALISVEMGNYAPTGCRIEGCSVDGGRPLIKSAWHDTVIR